MRIVCFGYRTWALNIYKRLQQHCSYELAIFQDKSHLNKKELERLNPTVVLLFGWSWIVPSEIIESYACYMLHPSDLPKYRGGSPIQNQILDGLKATKLTLFQMTDGIDDGPILGKLNLNLEGEITEIFGRMEEAGLQLTLGLLKQQYKAVFQNHSDATYCKRRTPEESEITLDDLKNLTGEELYNKIRCLTGPYPNAFIRTVDGKRLIIKSADLEN